MPRKSKSTSNTKSQPDSCEKDPQPTLTEDPGSAENTSPKDRDAGGKFTKGNAGGPGNPHARACAKMLEIFRNAISEDEVLQICRMLFLKAVGGDVSAAKIILSYKIGKPLPAHHPDSIDRDEWDHYQEDAVNEKEMKLVLSSLPTHAGNDIARVTLPIMTAARMNDLAAQLLDGLPAKRAEETGERGAENTGTSEPISNGKTSRRGSESWSEDQRSTDHQTASSHTSPAPHTEPLSNGKREKSSRGKKGRNKVKNQWMQPLVKRVKGNAANKV
jgi:hypothetical protein